jgi:hypothetical protein
MKATRLGIWMDHTTAHLMEFSQDKMETKTIDSTFTHEVKEATIHNGEKRMHQKEQHQQSGFYQQIGAVIKNYQEVLLFGPTEAKTELLNILLADHHFDKIKVEVKQADKMTENQKHAFVRAYFMPLSTHVY